MPIFNRQRNIKILVRWPTLISSSSCSLLHLLPHRRCFIPPLLRPLADESDAAVPAPYVAVDQLDLGGAVAAVGTGDVAPLQVHRLHVDAEVLLDGGGEGAVRVGACVGALAQVHNAHVAGHAAGAAGAVLANVTAVTIR